MSFLTAEWRKLVMANYVVDPQILAAYVPKGTSIDVWNDQCYVSLVGFIFLNTKLLGVKIPFHTNFEEVNLRFYVKRLENGEWKRGVVFIKEIVPKWALSWVANTIYKENYVTKKMRHSWETFKAHRMVEYTWKHQSKWERILVKASIASHSIEAASKAEFITEHYWGYAKVNEHKTNEYEVTHPRWQVYKVLDYDIEVDFERVYGKSFALMNNLKVDSVMLAEGSKITVEPKKQIK